MCRILRRASPAQDDTVSRLGIQLLAVYAIIAVALYFLPAER